MAEGREVEGNLHRSQRCILFIYLGGCFCKNMEAVQGEITLAWAYLSISLLYPLIHMVYWCAYEIITMFTIFRYDAWH